MVYMTISYTCTQEIPYYHYFPNTNIISIYIPYFHCLDKIRIVF